MRCTPVPFRLLGMVADPSHASALCGRAFARYAASGVDVTLACAAGDGLTAGDLAAVRALGVRNVILLGGDVSELNATALEPVVCDLIASLRPHVVVTEGSATPTAKAAATAFQRHRRGGSAALPARLYYRASVAVPVTVTTRIAVEGGQPEFFTRVYPAPWVTGVVETDLFAGLTDADPSGREHLLAS